MVSQYIYINAPLPSSYDPPHVEAEAHLKALELGNLLRRNDPALALPQGGTREEQLVGLFLDPEVLFGDASYVNEDWGQWVERFSVFTASKAPIEFVAMAFPYKSPNPLKTDRVAPDLGEALMLRRFSTLLAAVGEIYPPGARLTILEEGILGRCQGVDPQAIQAYRRGIELVMRIADVDPSRVVFHSLDDMVEEIPNFEARWIHEQERLRELWGQGDPEVRGAYGETVPAQRGSVPTWSYDPQVLAKAFDPDENDSALRYVRDYLDKVAHHQFFAYRSLLALRDSTGYLHKVRPHAIKLTVSPKRGNLAMLPVNSWTGILPYHGVPVLGVDGRWQVRYLASLGSLGGLEALRSDEDADPAPIGYQVLA